MSVKDVNYTPRSLPPGGPIPPITGIALSGNPTEYIDAENFNTKDKNEGNVDGNNPSMPSAIPFADGKDMRSGR